MTGAHFDPTFNIGHIITTITFAGTLAGVVWWQSNFQTRTEERLAASEMMRAQYIPIINDVIKLQNGENIQIANINTVLLEMQSVNREQQEAIAGIRERIAKIEGREGGAR